MRVAFTVPNYLPRTTGPSRTVAALAGRFEREGHDVVVHTLTPAGAGRDRPHVVRWTPGAARLRLASSLRDWDPDVVWVHEVWNPLARRALEWALRARVSIAVQPHGGLTAYRALPYAWQRAPYQLYDWSWKSLRDPRVTLIACSQRELEELSRRGRNPVLHLPLGTELRPVASLPRRGPIRLLMVANFGTFRDPRPVSEAVAILRREGLDLELRLVGPVQPQSRFARDAHPVAGEQGWTGAASDERLGHAYADADLFVYPSRYENFGLPLLEAAVSGLPLVAPDVGVFPEIADPDIDVTIAGPGRAPIVEAIRVAVGDLDSRRARARGRADRLAAAWNWDHRFQAYLRWLEGPRS